MKILEHHEDSEKITEDGIKQYCVASELTETASADKAGDKPQDRCPQ